MTKFGFIFKNTTATFAAVIFCFDIACLAAGGSKLRSEIGQIPPAPATDPQLPVHNPELIPPAEMPQSALEWRYPHNRQIARFAVIAGDQGGGPIRYNTRFPEVKGNPNPASYYHAAPFFGAEIEFSLARGGILLGGLARPDLWHRGITGRSVKRNEETWTVKQFSFSDSAFILGWVFGERYREVPWSADFSLVYDTGSITVKMSRNGDDKESEGRTRLIALSSRARMQFHLLTMKKVSFGAGPEWHFPLYYSAETDSDADISSILEDNLRFKSASAIGGGMSASFVF